LLIFVREFSDWGAGDVKNICILNGIHRGAIVDLGEDPVLIGGDEDCDALLSDSSAEGTAMSVSRGSGGDIVAEGVRGTVRRGLRTLRAGKRMTMTSGSIFRIGDVNVAVGNDLATAERAVGQGERQRTMLKWSGACVVGLVLFGVIGVVGGPADAYNSIKNVQASFTRSDASLRDPVGELEREIERVGLSGAVGILREGDGRIQATGSVNVDQRKRWDEVVRWYDGRFGSMVSLDARLAQRDDDIVLPFRIVSVLAAPGPRVVIQNGESFPVGSILPGGWEVRRIAELTVVLARGDREVAISF